MGLHVTDYWLCVGVSIWTILQTIVHVWWILHGRTLFSCHYEIRQKVELYIYYTYLYSNDCDNNPIMEYVTSGDRNSTVLASALANATTRPHGLGLYLQRDAVYPFYEKQPELTNALMLSNFVMDVVWFVASVSLLVGTVCKLKEWSAFFFLSPWIIVDVLVLSLDLFGAVYFGLQVQETHHNLSNSRDLSSEEFEVPNSAVMAIVSGRLGIIWLINCALLAFVVRATFRALRARYDDEHEKRLNTSREARIKNWQQFYGVIGEDTTDSSSTFKEKSATVSHEEYVNNYSSTFKDFKEKKGVNLSSTLRSSKGSFKSPMEALKGHLPWSYTQNTDDVPKAIAENNKHTNVLTIVPADVEEVVSKF